MRDAIKCFVLWSFLVTLCHVAGKPETLNAQKKSLISTAVGSTIDYLAGKVTQKSVASATKSFASAVAKHYSTKSEASLAIGINNNLMGRDLVNPRLYLLKGDAVGPAPLIIKAVADEDQRQTKVIFLDGKNVKGILCYHRVTEGIANFLVCVYFDKVEQKFTVTIEYVTGTVNEVDLITKFTTISTKSSLVDAKSIDSYVLFYTNENEKLNSEMDIFAQMTTGPNTRLVLDVFDTRPTVSAKREVITGIILTGMIAAAPSVLYTAVTTAYNYLKAVKATILSLDNLSTAKESLVLQDPIWTTTEVKIENIIPGILGPRQSTDITFTTSSSGSTSFSMVSYHIRNSDYRLVIANWWPVKIQHVKQMANRYSVFRLLAVDGKTARSQFHALAGAIRKSPKDAETARAGFIDTLNDPWTFIENTKYQRYWYWRIPIDNAQENNKRYLKVLTAMGSGKKNGLVVKVFASTLAPGATFETAVLGPQDFVYTPEEIPPEYF